MNLTENSAFRNYIFNVYQITTSGGFSGKARDKNTAQNAPKHAISSKKKYFPGEGAIVLLSPDSSPSGEG